jgi:phage-related protein
MAVVISIIGKYDDKGIAKAQKELAGLGGSADKNSKVLGALGGAAKIAGVAALGAAVGFGAFAVKGIAAAEEAATAQARLDQVAKSMGFVGGAYEGATQRLQTYASELSKQIAVEDETILSVQAKLATFKEVGKTMDEAGGAMDRATQAAFDLAATGFGSAETNAIQLGKALNDPVKGISALSRAGVTFTEAEKEKIKVLVESGKAAEAQEMILGALDSQVGGVAAATANASDKMKVGFSELQENVGTALLPTFNKIADTLIPIMESLQEPLAQVAQVIGGVLSEAFDAIAPVIPIVAKAFADIAGVVAGALGAALSALIPVLTPVLETFAALVEKIGPLLQPLLDKIAGLLANVLSALVPLIDPLTEFVFTLLEALAPILDIVIDVLMILVDALKPILNAIIPILPALSSLIELLGKILTPILEALTPVIEVLANVLSDVLVRAVGLILTALGYLIIGFSKLAPFVLENVTKPIVSAFITMAENVVGAAASMLGWVPGLGDKLNEAKDAIGTFKTQAEDAISSAADTISKEGTRIGEELVANGVESMTNPEAVKKTKNAGIKMGENLAGGVIQGLQNTQLDVNSTSAKTIQGAIDAAKNTAGVKSPSTVFAEIGKNLTQGLVQGIKAGGDDVRKVLQESFVSWFSETKDKLKGELQEIRGEMQDFAATVASTMSSLFDFGSAQTGSTDRLKAIAEAEANLAKAQKDYNEAAAKALESKSDAPSMEAVLAAQSALASAKAAGENLGLTFIQSLNSQANQAFAFGAKIDQALALGLTRESLAKVLEAGPIVGSEILDSLIAGGVETINQTNQLVESVSAAAKKVGEQTGIHFFGTGVTSAQETYNGFKANFGKGGPARKAMENLMDNLAESLNRTSTITVTTVNRVITENVRATPRAKGGPVSPSELYLVGEKGPEFFVPNTAGNIIPNDKITSMSGRSGNGNGGSGAGSGTTINLTVNAGMGTQGAEVGRQIVDALKAYERRNGSVYVSA